MIANGERGTKKLKANKTISVINVINRMTNAYRISIDPFTHSLGIGLDGKIRIPMFNL
jgi:hypothetical protein